MQFKNLKKEDVGYCSKLSRERESFLLAGRAGGVNTNNYMNSVKCKV